MLTQELLGILPSLTNPLARIAEPRACFLDHTGLNAEIEQFAGAADTLAVYNIEFDLAERGRHLVLDHFDPGLIANNLLAFLDLTGASDFQPNRRIKLQSVTAGR